MSNYVEIKKTSKIKSCIVSVPASKSESNRALIIKALAKSATVRNLSTARDTQTMSKLLKSKDHILDVIDAGTTMRFLTAYLAVTGQDKIITGTKRMCERPIGILVDALRQLGAEIEYTRKEGYPPLHLKGIKSTGIEKIRMKGNISSQYISAILLISPLIKNGLKLELTGKIGSRPYIDMTLGIMKHFGVEVISSQNQIYIPQEKYQDVTFTVDPDWSGASYWYAITALAAEGSIFLKGLNMPSYQGDSIIKDIMVDLGVKSKFKKDGVELIKSDNKREIKIDFSNFPDLAQTVSVVCAAKGIRAYISGLESLRIKETDRIAALQNELSKINSQLIERNTGEWELIPVRGGNVPEGLTISTYNDHRMAMAFAPLATLTNIRLEQPSVVHKSYPSFWNDMKNAGFQVRYL